jgi:hypothetical protein
MTGTLETIDGRPALRFERRNSHSVERVWRALTDPSELIWRVVCQPEQPGLARWRWW